MLYWYNHEKHISLGSDLVFLDIPKIKNYIIYPISDIFAENNLLKF